MAFTPTWRLWTDGAVKRRWVSLPPGGTIDTSDPDRWVFPVGTRFFKEFAAPDGTLLEIFEWISSKAADEAHQHPSIRTMWNKLATVADFVPLSAVQEAGKAFSHFEALSATSPRVRALAAKRPASKRPKR